MSAFYDRLNATAQRLIATYGKSATIIRQTNTGTDYAPALTDVPHAAIVVSTGYTLSMISQTLIQAGDQFGIISTAIDITPNMQDKITIDGGRYNFVDIKPLNPGGTVLLYEFLARK